MKPESKFPEARYAIARLFVLLAWHALPKNADWPKERLWTVNSSIKQRLKLLRSEASHGE
ncbi:hypothetical protein U2P60_14710 [Brucella sp. H1_1004]|uniref:hypothetical protein n=1 Tax=Brucella sp. H1_1004 TaxID=3110109 RepID=UPI0039B43D33